MKAILEFSLPEDERQLRLAVRSPDLLAALFDVKSNLRLHLKHGVPEDDRRVLEEMRDAIYDALLEFEE